MLLTRSPLEHPPEEGVSLDLHVLSTPPAFVLSQDQTLHRDLEPIDPAFRQVYFDQPKIGESAYELTELARQLAQKQTDLLSVCFSANTMRPRAKGVARTGF